MWSMYCSLKLMWFKYLIVQKLMWLRYCNCPKINAAQAPYLDNAEVQCTAIVLKIIVVQVLQV